MTPDTPDTEYVVLTRGVSSTDWEAMHRTFSEADAKRVAQTAKEYGKHEVLVLRNQMTLSAAI